MIDFANLTDQQIAEYALDTGEAAFKCLVGASITAGPNGPGSLHLRVGSGAGDEFKQWGERTIGNGGDFAVNTVGKANTATKYLMNSDDANRRYHHEIPDGPGRWTGGVYVEVHASLDKDIDGHVTIKHSVSAASGVQGEIDRVVASTTANTAVSLMVLREKARYEAGRTAENPA